MVFSFIARRVTLTAAASIVARSVFNPAFNVVTRRTFSVSPVYLAAAVKQPRTTKKSTPTKKTSTKKTPTKKSPTKVAVKKSGKGRPKTEAAGKKVPKRIPEAIKPPKGPPSPYLLFFSSFVKSQAPAGSKTIQDYQELAKRAGEAWHGLSAAEKQPFYDENQTRQAQHLKDKEEYLRNHGVGSLRKLNKIRVALGKNKVHIRGMHERPHTPFLRFVNDFKLDPESSALVEKAAPGKPGGVRTLVAAGARWRSMSTEQKAPYFEQYRKEKEEYDVRKAS